MSWCDGNHGEEAARRSEILGQRRPWLAQPSLFSSTHRHLESLSLRLYLGRF